MSNPEIVRGVIVFAGKYAFSIVCISLCRKCFNVFLVFLRSSALNKTVELNVYFAQNITTEMKLPTSEFHFFSEKCARPAVGKSLMYLACIRQTLIPPKKIKLRRRSGETK